MIDRFAVGLAALGRPAYINLGREAALPQERSLERMRCASFEVLDAAYAAGVRWVDVARSYGKAEQFLAEWLTERGHEDVTVSSKWGYSYVAGWRRDAQVHEVKEHSLARFNDQLAETRALLGDRLSLYQVHSLTAESPLFTDRTLQAGLARLVERGVRVGFSTSGPSQGDTVRRALELEVDGRRLFSAVQSTWNLLEPSVGPALAEAHDAGVQVLVKEALANGRLAVTPPDPLRTIAERRQTGPDAVALSAALARPWADIVLLGPASSGQLHSNLRAAGPVLDGPDFDGPGFDGPDFDRLGELALPPERYWSERGALAWD